MRRTVALLCIALVLLSALLPSAPPVLLPVAAVWATLSVSGAVAPEPPSASPGTPIAADVPSRAPPLASRA